jgi:transcriptional antiterminator RfaH
MRYAANRLTRDEYLIGPTERQPESRWYVIQSKPRKEAFAGANLENQGFRIFLPKVRKTVRHARRTRKVEVALFPRYLFVALDLSWQRWRSVSGTLGVSHFITDGSLPLPAPHGLIEDLIATADRAGVVDLSRSLTRGQGVRLLDGPFAGQIGRLVDLDEAGRAKVLLHILGAQREISVAPSVLAPAEDQARRP